MRIHKMALLLLDMGYEYMSRSVWVKISVLQNEQQTVKVQNLNKTHFNKNWIIRFNSACPNIKQVSSLTTFFSPCVAEANYTNINQILYALFQQFWVTGNNFQGHVTYIRMSSGYNFFLMLSNCKCKKTANKYNKNIYIFLEGSISLMFFLLFLQNTIWRPIQLHEKSFSCQLQSNQKQNKEQQAKSNIPYIKKC